MALQLLCQGSGEQHVSCLRLTIRQPRIVSFALLHSISSMHEYTSVEIYLKVVIVKSDTGKLIPITAHVHNPRPFSGSEDLGHQQIGQ